MKKEEVNRKADFIVEERKKAIERIKEHKIVILLLIFFSGFS